MTFNQVLAAGAAAIVAWVAYGFGHKAGLEGAPEYLEARRERAEASRAFDESLRAEAERERAHEAALLARFGCSPREVVAGMEFTRLRSLLDEMGFFDELARDEFEAENWTTETGQERW